MARVPCRLALPALVFLVLFARLAGGEPDTPRLVGPFAKDEYPQAVIDRPLTLPAGMVEGEVGGSFISRRFRISEFEVSGADDWEMDVALRVGVTDRLQIEAGTAFSLDHVQRGDEFQGVQDVIDVRPSKTSWRRVVPLRLSFLALDTEPLDTAVTLTLPFTAHASRTHTFGRGGEVTFSNGDGRVLPAVELAAPTRWRLTDRLWLRAGENLFRVTTGEGLARLALDLGMGVQLHQIFAVTLDSRIASIEFDGDGHETQTPDDVGTIDLEGTFAPLPGFDVIGSLGLPDVGRRFEDYVLRIAVRVRL